MLRDKVNAYNLLFGGLFFIFLGILFFTRWRLLWALIYGIVVLGFAYLGISQIFSYFIKRRQKLNTVNLFNILVTLAILIYALLQPFNFLVFIPYVIGWWALANGLVQAINFYVYRRDCMRGAGWRFVLAALTLIMAAVLILAPASYMQMLSRLAGAYLIFYGLVTVFETAKDLLSDKTQRKLLRHMNLSVPIVVAALLPQRVFMSVNTFLKSGQLQQDELSSETSGDLEVYFYLSGSGPESLGHVDISYQGKIYSYGCHDPENRRLMGTLGDGVLIVSEREAFLRHALCGERKTIIGYEISLTQKQKEAVEERIAEMMNRSVPWQPLIQRGSGDPEAHDYASRVYRGTHAQMYKFKAGDFRTYFVFSTNCVLLADHILRCPQLDLFNFTGIVTPGSYLVFLNDEYLREGSLVVARRIYKREEAAPKKTED